MTYSIIALDHESGAFGVAIQSHWFNVGRDAPWVRYGVGVVVTQATTDPSYGWRGLDAMSAGRPPEEALQQLLSEDPDAEHRQVGMLDASGKLAVHTGTECIPHASHLSGTGWAVLGNLLSGPEVVEEMSRVFRDADGTLAERMVAAMEAAERAGGDVRGSQSAAIRVSPGSEELASGYEPGIQISIADHTEPIGELRRLVEVDRSYRALRRGQQALDEGNEPEARLQFELASHLRHGVEVDFWRAIGLARLGEFDMALEVLRAVIRERPAFADVLDRGATKNEVMSILSERLTPGMRGA